MLKLNRIYEFDINDENYNHLNEFSLFFIF